MFWSAYQVLPSGVLNQPEIAAPSGPAQYQALHCGPYLSKNFRKSPVEIKKYSSDRNFDLAITGVNLTLVK